MMFQQLPGPEKPSKEAMFSFKPPRVLPRIVAPSGEPDDLSSRGWLPVERVRRCTENGEASGSQGMTTANLGNYRECLTESRSNAARPKAPTRHPRWGGGGMHRRSNAVGLSPQAAKLTRPLTNSQYEPAYLVKTRSRDAFAWQGKQVFRNASSPGLPSLLK